MVALGLTLVASAFACYRPHLVDCVVACQAPSACPEGMTCEAGLCTRGTTCTVEIAAGGRHTCALRAGLLACWGSNAFGQLGGPAGDLSDSERPVPRGSVAWGAGRRPTAVVVGGRHTCALVDRDSAMELACWGDNSLGQLGPAPGSSGAVPLGSGPAVAAAAAGLYHSCALLQDGQVRCWGDNRFGQLGVPGAANSRAAGSPPLTVDLGGVPARAVSAGAYHSCALLEGGGVRCWGWNDYGQLGNTVSLGGERAPGLILAVDLGGGRRAQAVAAGAFHTCALSDEGEVLCWGQNDAGQLGVPLTSTARILPPGASVDLGPARWARQLVAGTSHTCAVLDDFSVKCWGLNTDGQLGISSTVNLGGGPRPGPPLPGVALGTGDPVSRISAGANHTCVVQAADVKCWGFGGAGRLGTGDLRNRGDGMRPIVPVVLPVPAGF